MAIAQANVTKMNPDTTSEVKLPRRRDYRQRAHCNQYSDHEFKFPRTPDEFDLKEHYPEFLEAHGEVGKDVKFVDVGCGYGGLIISLSPLFPDTLMLGIEIRNKIAEYVDKRIKALRARSSSGVPNSYYNVSVMRLNAIRYLPNLFKKGQLEKIFFLFPDPHFKKKKYKSRIITSPLLATYAYLLKENGSIYISTDVPNLFEWMKAHLQNFPLFREYTKEEFEADICCKYLCTSTEESEKAKTRNASFYSAAYRRISSLNNPKCDSFVSLYTQLNND